MKLHSLFKAERREGDKSTKGIKEGTKDVKGWKYEINYSQLNYSGISIHFEIIDRIKLNN
jgi:hypothetical protein